MPNCTVAMLLMGMRLKTGRSAEGEGRLKQVEDRMVYSVEVSPSANKYAQDR